VGQDPEVALFSIDQMLQRLANRAERARNRRIQMLVRKALADLDQAQRRPGLVSIEFEQRGRHSFLIDPRGKGKAAESPRPTFDE
jgi:hypothetical protein